MWNYVSEGYRNFSAYFNTYYNASSAYNTALKDVRTSQKEFYISKIAGTSQGAYTISVVARQNFDLAIQEASKVLQFFPNSAFTEDCLYLVGISYYYEGNTMGGTREFTEAEDAFPRSRRIDEAEMYMGGLQLEAQQAHEGENHLFKARSLAEKYKDRKVLSLSANILSEYFLERGDTAMAASYLDSAAVTTKGDDAAIYYTLEGNLLSNIGDYSSATVAYQEASKHAKDVRLRFYAKYNLARTFRLEHKYRLALSNLKQLRGDDNFYTYFPLVEYQRAAVLCDSGDVSTGVAEFQKIDTVSATNEAATRSAYKLGNIYLYQVGDYQTALKYYQKCTSHPAVYNISTRARDMGTNLTQYFIAWYKMKLADSLYYSTLSMADSSSDSARAKMAADLDTLYQHAAEARHQLAGFFMFRLQIPDSALRSYRIVVDDFPKSTVRPSALYTLGEYYYSGGDSSTGEKYLNSLITEYPQSIYSTSACSLLGITRAAVADTSQMIYDRAIHCVGDDSLDSAIVYLRSLLNRTKSPILPQAMYALGWIYENKLRLLDSAYVYYDELVKDYPGTDFSSNVTVALTGYEEAKRDSIQAAIRARDSVKALENKSAVSKPDSSSPPPAVRKKAMPDTVLPGGHAAPDSLSEPKKLIR